MLERLRDYLNHRRHADWQFAGADESNGSEGHWYWHIEECRWCDRRRTVMNMRYCACGYNNGIKEAGRDDN